MKQRWPERGQMFTCRQQGSPWGFMAHENKIQHFFHRPRCSRIWPLEKAKSIHTSWKPLDRVILSNHSYVFLMFAIRMVKRNNTYLWCILSISSPHIRLQDQNSVPHRGENIFLLHRAQIVCGYTQHRGYSSAKIETAEALGWPRLRGVEINFNVGSVIMLKVSENGASVCTS